MTLTDIQRVLSGAKLVDVVVTGFVEMDVVPVCFHALWHVVYFDFDGRILEVATIGDSGRIRLDVVEAPRHTAVLDEGMLPAFASIQRQALRDPDGANEVVEMRLWSMLEVSGSVQCDAVRFDLINGQQLFVDPSNYFGIRLGGHEQQRLWEENWPRAHGRQMTVSLRDSR